MFFKILKKDLARKKSMNAILFLFIALCTVFAAGSLSNMTITRGAVSYFGELTHASDYLFVTSKESDVTTWLASNERVDDFSKERGLALSSDAIHAGANEFEVRGTFFLMTTPTDFNLVLDEANNVLPPLKEGECALSYNDSVTNNLTVGDTITIEYGSEEKKFVLSQITKDMVFGSSYMGASRILVSEADYLDMAADENSNFANLYSVITDEPLQFERELLGQSFVLYTNFDKSMLESVYTLDTVIAAILMVVSVLLLLIAFVILRFTIAFTLQEDYREIGVMKAIGLKNRDIRKLYLAKDLALAVVGAALGIAASFPFSTFMTQGIQNNMALESTSANPLLNILAGIAIVVLVLLFCSLTIQRVSKLSAVQAMRSGATGENYATRKLYAIHKHQGIAPALQMAVNDVLCNTKNYVALIITFTLGILMIILPVNAINTLKGDNILDYLGSSTSDVYVTTFEEDIILATGTREAVVEKVEDLEDEYRSGGVVVDFYVDCAFNIAVYLDNPDEGMALLAFQSYDLSADRLTPFKDSVAPLLSNEVALTQLALDRIGAAVGDTVHVTLGGETREYLVVSAYESMEMMGYSMRFSETAPLNYAFISSLFAFQGNLIDRENIDLQRATMKEIAPDYRLQTPGEYAKNTLGSVIATVDMVKNIILAVVLVIYSLITVLLMRSFLARDAGEIALLGSIGFRSSTLRAWQALRIIIVLFCSLVLGALLSNLLNPLIAYFTFGIMGAANIPLIIRGEEVFLLYPITLFVVTSVVAVLSVGAVRKHNLKDIGNME